MVWVVLEKQFYPCVIYYSLIKGSMSKGGNMKDTVCDVSFQQINIGH